MYMLHLRRYKNANATFTKLCISRMNIEYGNAGCGVFKQGVQNYKVFLPMNQHTQRKLLNFKNWISMGLRSFQKSEF